MSFVNSTVTFDTKETIDLEILRKSDFVYTKRYKRWKRKKYNPFVCVYVKEPNTNHLFSVYATGKGLLLGCKSIDEIANAMKWFDKTFNTTSVHECKNLVHSFDTFTNLDLSKLFYANKGSFLEPELFPSLTLDVAQGKALIFRTGKIILTGFRNEQQIKEAELEVYRLIGDQLWND